MSLGSRNGKRFDFEAAEHWIGREWIDGKPIYRRVIPLANPGNGASDSNTVDLSEIETVIRAEAMLHVSGTGWLNFIGDIDITATANGTITANHQGINMTGRPAPQCIIEYTKSSGGPI